MCALLEDNIYESSVVLGPTSDQDLVSLNHYNDIFNIDKKDFKNQSDRTSGEKSIYTPQKILENYYQHIQNTKVKDLVKKLDHKMLEIIKTKSKHIIIKYKGKDNIEVYNLLSNFINKSRIYVTQKYIEEFNTKREYYLNNLLLNRRSFEKYEMDLKKKKYDQIEKHLKLSNMLKLKKMKTQVSPNSEFMFLLGSDYLMKLKEVEKKHIEKTVFPIEYYKNIEQFKRITKLEISSNNLKIISVLERPELAIRPILKYKIFTITFGVLLGVMSGIFAVMIFSIYENRKYSVEDLNLV